MRRPRTMFIYTKEGYVNPAQVARIDRQWQKNGEVHHVFYSASGKVIGTSDDQALDIDMVTAPIVPAAPGSTVHLLHSPCNEARKRPVADDVWVQEVPVVAWRCHPLGAIPITHDDDNLTTARILHPLPNGQFLSAGGQTSETIAEALADTLSSSQAWWDMRNGAPAEARQPDTFPAGSMLN